jgi:ribonuclease D
LKNKFEYAEQEFRNLLSFKPKPENPDKWRSLNGLHEVKSEIGLAIARSVWHAREQLAQKLDVAPGRLIPDASISHIAKSRPRSKPELASDKNFAGRASRTYLDTWWKAIEDGSNSRDLPALKVTHIGIPNHRSWPTRWPTAHRRLTLVRAALTDLANSLEVPLENLLSPETIRQVCWPERESVSTQTLIDELRSWKARPWQIELVVETIANEIARAAMVEENRPDVEG